MTQERFAIDGSTAIVTGASRGIGRTIAEQFAAEGADVVVCSREQENVDPVAEGITEGDAPGSALAVECDVTEREQVDALVEASLERFGDIDVLVNNAGANFVAPFEDISENGWKTIVDINLHGTYHMSQAVGEVMRENGGGAIINISSTAGERGSPGMTHYGAAKAGIINLTTSLAHEWADDGVRVNCIAPGFVATPGVAEQMGVTAEEVDRETVDRRIGRTDEIADVVQFLASDASSFIVGETIPAKGLPRVLESPEG
ncbi:MAG: SDR family NAD(P)-dependent oxidoreductase [Halodesulfurarchaeum sp.]